MSLKINIKHLEAEPKTYEGQLTAAELDMDTQDDLIKVSSSLSYQLSAELHESNILLSGELEQTFQYECARCLKPFEKDILISSWNQIIQLNGENAMPVDNDCIDLTQALREDILLSLPQHPLCTKDCRGIGNSAGQGIASSEDQLKAEAKSSAWTVLDQLQLD
ncbi:MAG: hypothetical protein M2R45_03993 [Verrucomicrobia subdivision 3 bacterium]|nr:hypothetical protein [Limisphaerales bacterium]MCS1415487.1 hypothetical protein [Limisphaerales bacterium]